MDDEDSDRVWSATLVVFSEPNESWKVEDILIAPWTMGGPEEAMDTLLEMLWKKSF
jgi:hypothetical protein